MHKRLIISILLVFLGTAARSQAVYKTPSGEKYHLAACHMVKNVSQKLTIEEAVAMGLAPCKICKPGTAGENSPQKKAKGESTSVQCRGTTKAGTRCRHMTRIANGYCYQHQP